MSAQAAQCRRFDWSPGFVHKDSSCHRGVPGHAGAVVDAQPIVTSRLLLQPVTSEMALAVVNGQASDIIRPGAGWPHADTADAMEMALLPGAGPGWLITLDDMVIGDCGAFSWPAAGGIV